ncbi:AmmeMemoRadiSam system radical SAM enzyme [Deferribacteraceae bacterium V6Fe1]|nr:AmmeMemoRadiSam system radical SAM enzyme [Deferribacteraceae bacterium V6Fe1]
MLKLASYFESLAEDGAVRCNLCPHRCKVKNGGAGLCLIRKNIDGKLYQASYGEVTSVNLDPIEKKPLYHFYPSSNILSIGTNGCNLKCAFCQNYTISTQETFREEVSVLDLVNLAKKHNSIGIAYTYNEPTIWFEFVLDCAKVFRENGLKNVIVSNGNINREPLLELIKVIDTANIDLKGFTDGFYNWVKGDLNTVKETIRLLFENNIHTEVTFLLIPNRNDKIDDFTRMCEYLMSISKDIPLHISRYFPTYKCNEPTTDIAKMLEFYKEAKKYLNYVYLGNISAGDNANSYCPDCGNLLVKRDGYYSEIVNKKDVCEKCSRKLYFRL